MKKVQYHSLLFFGLITGCPGLTVHTCVCVAAEDEESTIEEQESMEVAAEQKEELVELTKEG